MSFPGPPEEANGEGSYLLRQLYPPAAAPHQTSISHFPAPDAPADLSKCQEKFYINVPTYINSLNLPKNSVRLSLTIIPILQMKNTVAQKGYVPHPQPLWDAVGQGRD